MKAHNSLSSILLSSIKNNIVCCFGNRKLPKPLEPSRCPKLNFYLCQGGKNNFYCLKKIKENFATLSFLSFIPKNKAKQKNKGRTLTMKQGITKGGSHFQLNTTERQRSAISLEKGEVFKLTKAYLL